MPIDANDRQAIDDLFARLGDTERQTGPRDAEAEALIRQKLAAQPAAPYYMAQTIVMQEYALRSAQERIEQLERALAERPAGGGFLSGLFGGGRAQPAPRRPAGPQPGLQPNAAVPGRGGGFLAGAAQTAMGVAGGVLLGNLIAGMFSSNDAAAATPPAAAQDASPANDATADDGGDDFGGDDEI